jgi:nitrite reductase/ring-hydroxylating ferredoxin subunit
MDEKSPESLIEKGFERVAAVHDIPEQMPRLVQVRGRGVLLCRSSDGVHALAEICPHKNESMKFGVVFMGKLICPHHQYGFHLDSGRCDKRRCEAVTTYEVEMVGDEVFVR